MRPAEYRIDNTTKFEIGAKIADRPRVTESVQLKPGSFCEECVITTLLGRADLLADRERTRGLYLREVQRRQAANDPFHCSTCRDAKREWVYLPDERQHPAGYCRSCLYLRLRNEALKNAVGFSNSRARSQAMLAAMENARQQTRYLFEFAWGVV
jgi:hypothetical protein